MDKYSQPQLSINRPRISRNLPCPGCKSPVSSSDKFCRECGHKLTSLSTPTTHQNAEKRLVTIIFTDITGYTSLTEILDPEEVQDILKKIYRASKEVVDRYGGIVHEIIGDCAVILFGEPQAKEDDAIRALLTAEGIHQAVKALNTPELEHKIGRSLTMHTGINTGNILIAYDHISGNRQIVGDAVNVAARLDSMANSDQILVTKSTQRLCKGKFQFETLDAQKVKGKSEALEVFRYKGKVSNQVVQSSAQERRSKLIGRDGEMKQLTKRFEKLTANEPTLITLHAEPGAGKSRLISEWKARINSSEFNFIQAQANAIYRNSTYAIWSDFFQKICGTAEYETQEEVRAHSESKLLEIGLDNTTIPWLGRLLQLDYAEVADQDSSIVKERIFQGVLNVIELLARSRPTVLVLEDLHWIDDLSHELLLRIVKELRAPLMLIITYRNGFELGLQPHDLPELHHLDMGLSAFSKGQGEAMLQSLLQTVEVPAALKSYVAEKIAGNPFYIEEFVHHLLDTGKLVKNGRWHLNTDLVGQNIPNTIEGVIQARIDGLENDTKRLLQQASVIGRSFYYQILDQISSLEEALQSHLSLLQQNEIIKEEQLHQVKTYSFRHALTQEITYRSMLKKDRRSIHFQVARTIEDNFANQLFDYYEILAHHYKEAEANAKAVEFLILSGKKKLHELSAEESHKFFEQAYEIEVNRETEGSESKLLLLLTEWGFTMYHLGTTEFGRTLFEKHLPLAEASEDLRLKAWYFGWFMMLESFSLRDANIVEQLAAKALDFAKRSGDERVKAYIFSWYASNVASLIRNSKLGEKYGLQAIDITKTLPHDGYLMGKCIYGTSISLALNGRWQTAHRILTEGLQAGRDLKSPRIISLVQFGLGIFHLNKGEFLKAAAICFESATNAPDRFYKMLGLTFAGYAYSVMEKKGEFERVEHEYRQLDPPALPMFDYAWKASRGNHDINLGQMREGYIAMKSSMDYIKAGGFMGYYLQPMMAVGDIYIQLATFNKRPPLKHVLRNLTFLLWFTPRMNNLVKNTCIEMGALAKERGYDMIEAMTYLKLGDFYGLKNNKKQAKKYWMKALELIEMMEMPEQLEATEKKLSALSQ